MVKFKTGLDVRVGYPTEHLSSESMEEVSHPMYSTSVGLVLKGFENLDKNQPKVRTKVEEKVNEEIPEFEDQEQEVEKKESKLGIFGGLKKVFSDIFDEEDAEM